MINLLFSNTIFQNPLPVRLSAKWATNRQQEKSNKRKQEQNLPKLKNWKVILV
jgi:hypothetical protein